MCGYTREVHHLYEIKNNDSTHWKECSVYGDAIDVEDHVPGQEATETTDQVCLVCGYVIQKANSSSESTEMSEREESNVSETNTNSDSSQSEEDGSKETGDGSDKTQDSPDEKTNGNHKENRWWIIVIIAVVVLAAIPLPIGLSIAKKRKKKE